MYLFSRQFLYTNSSLREHNSRRLVRIASSHLRDRDREIALLSRRALSLGDFQVTSLSFSPLKRGTDISENNTIACYRVNAYSSISRKPKRFQRQTVVLRFFLFVSFFSLSLPFILVHVSCLPSVKTENPSSGTILTICQRQPEVARARSRYRGQVGTP